MKALTLTQPWASLVAIGEKHMETRSWQTAYRGTLAIHAAKRWTHGQRALCGQYPFRTALTRHVASLDVDALRGHVLAVVRLVGITRTEDTEPSTHEASFGDFTPGRFAWHFEDPVLLLKPVLARGSLGLWVWNP